MLRRKLDLRENKGRLEEMHGEFNDLQANSSLNTRMFKSRTRSRSGM